jgi:hypothetical protein
MQTIRKLLKRVARPEGFEPPTLCLEGRGTYGMLGAIGEQLSNSIWRHPRKVKGLARAASAGGN